MIQFGTVVSPIDAEHPQTSAYKSIEIFQPNIPINFDSPSFGNPLWEEKPTSTILSDIEETMTNLRFATELIAWEIASDEALVNFEVKLLE